ncbi:MAG: hypothetical protein LAP87_15645 [Acidobacteriia bacterium]|nr:hypothetical protein [Terriglobia bacterium]
MLVAVAGQAHAPTVILRRRLELADPGVRGSVQPYHAAAEMSPGEGSAFLERCAAASNALAERTVREAVAELGRQGYRALASCILLASGRPLPPLAAILAAHPLIHTAEGVFFREALHQASERCGLLVTAFRERDLPSQAAAALRIPADELLRRASALGKAAGPPWRQDEKLSALAAWLALASRPATTSATRR